MEKIVCIAALFICASASLAQAQTSSVYQFPITHKQDYSKTATETTLNFTKNSKLQYGLGIAFTYPAAQAEASRPYSDEAAKTTFTTSAFLNYRISPSYSLASSIKYINGNETAMLLSLEARKVNVFSRKHRLTTMLNVNWSNQTNPSQDLWLARDRQYMKGLELNNNRGNQTALGFGAKWNWEIDTNWSLATGINANLRLNGTEKNLFTTQRAPVTIFSVATYRF